MQFGLSSQALPNYKAELWSANKIKSTAVNSQADDNSVKWWCKDKETNGYQGQKEKIELENFRLDNLFQHWIIPYTFSCSYPT